MIDMFSILNKVKDAQQKIKEAQNMLPSIVVTAEAGAGLVKATVNGARQVIRIEIDPSLKNDLEMIQDLAVAATNLAMKQAEEKAKEYMQDAVKGIMPNVPGLDLESFMK